MPDDVTEVRRRIAAVQELPDGRCTRCSAATGKIAPHYAVLEVGGMIIYMPFCQCCIDAYLEQAEAQRPGAGLESC